MPAGGTDRLRGTHDNRTRRRSAAVSGEPPGRTRARAFPLAGVSLIGVSLIGALHCRQYRATGWAGQGSDQPCPMKLQLSRQTPPRATTSNSSIGSSFASPEIPATVCSWPATASLTRPRLSATTSPLCPSSPPRSGRRPQDQPGRSAPRRHPDRQQRGVRGTESLEGGL